MTTAETNIRKGLNREILRLTLPTIVSNVSVPLLGLCDTAVAGHMKSEVYLAGIAIGSMLIGSIYWLFNFLRAGTSGLTAEAYGASDRDAMGCVLLRSASLGVALGVVLLSLQRPLIALLLSVMGASPEVTSLADRYLSICIWGAVPMMLIMSVSGWFVGMQSTKLAMYLNIGLSGINLVFTVSYVFLLRIGYEGIPYGTLTAQWTVLIPAAVMVRHIWKGRGIRFADAKRNYSDARQWFRLFDVNANLFFRSGCMIAASMTLTAVGARLGDVVVGANAVINQLYLFFSYFIDGLAFTGEAMVGRFAGARRPDMLRLSVRLLIRWTWIITLIFALAYSAFLPEITSLLSDSAAVRKCVESCWIWVPAIPLAGATAFIFDGFYVGLTHTRQMLISTMAGLSLFFILLAVIPHSQQMLWMAFVCYLALRSLILALLFPKSLSKIEHSV